MDAQVPGIYEQIANKIRELRTTAKGQTISQEALAQAVNTTANTISRWETATYKPSISDLEALAQFFGVPITVFFPQAQPKSRDLRASALLSAAADLDDDDLDEVALYARFRRAQRRKKKKR